MGRIKEKMPRSPCAISPSWVERHAHGRREGVNPGAHPTENRYHTRHLHLALTLLAENRDDLRHRRTQALRASQAIREYSICRRTRHASRRDRRQDNPRQRAVSDEEAVSPLLRKFRKMTSNLPGVLSCSPLQDTSSFSWFFSVA